MGTVVAIGEEALVRGFSLAGAVVLAAEDPDAVRAAWHGLAAEVAVVVLTPAALAALADADRTGGWPLVAVMD